MAEPALATPPSEPAAPAAPPTALTAVPAPAAPAPAAPAPAAPAPATEVVYDLKLPEGIKLSDATLAEVKAFAKANGLSAEAAQGMVNLKAKAIGEVTSQYAAEVEGFKAKWAEDARADKDFGGDKFDANVAVAAGVVNTYGTPELKELLNATGLGNHPEIIRLFHKVGQVLSEDSVASAIASAGSRELTAAERLYGKN